MLFAGYSDLAPNHKEPQFRAVSAHEWPHCWVLSLHAESQKWKDVEMDPKPGLTALAEPRKTRKRTKDACLCLLRRPSGHWSGMRAAPPRGMQVSAAASSLPKRASSRSPLRRGAGEGGVLPTDPGSNPRLRRATPPGTTHRPRWKAPRPRVPPPILQGGYRGGGREAAATKQAAAGASQSLLRTSAPTHPVLRVIAQLDFLAQATGNLHGCSARGCPRSQLPVSSRRTGGRRGRDEKAGSPRDRDGTRCRRHALVLAAPTERRLGPAS